MLVIAWKMDAKRMGFFTKQEWLKGFSDLQFVIVILFDHRIYLKYLLISMVTNTDVIVPRNFGRKSIR